MAFSHHGDGNIPAKPNPVMVDLMKRFLDQAEKPLKRTYSEGRIGPDDEGDLVFAVASDPGKGVVMLNFNKPATWMGMPPAQAVLLAQLLIKHARAITKEPLAVTI